MFNDFSPQFKHLFDGAGLANPLHSKTTQSKKSKLNDENVLDMSSAYLGPQIWNEMMMAEDLKLEPVDLDKLLSENASDDLENEILDDLTSISPSLSPKSMGGEAPSDLFLYSSASNISPKPTLAQYSPVQSNFTSFETVTTNAPSPTLFQPQPMVVENTLVEPAEPPKEQDAPVPATLQCNFQPSITDVMISTPTNGLDEPTELFDPSKRCFSEEELKPQPIIRKARKSYVASDCKDTKYWQKREKNNIAAKRSREAKRIKENQIAMRANFLEKENGMLKQEVQDLRKELVHLMKVVKAQEQK